MSGRLEGKVAIVTGGARGMGAATVRAFVAEGASVVIADRLVDHGTALAEELGSAASFVSLDVTQEASWEALVRAVESQHGRADALVNNAGVVAFGPIEAIDPADIDRVFAVNVKGPLLGMKHVGNLMRAARRGSIVNISSVDGLRGANALSIYSSSKWAIRGLTKTAALEFGPHGVRVNSVHPGGVDTHMGNPQQQQGAERNWSYTRVPLQRIGEPHEVAMATLFLCSDEASYVTGAELAVDGGWAAGYYHHYMPGAPASLNGG
ncbi:glucose 1-dehydrogenase [Sphingomonas sp. RP10(2022)]|uniref:Glucose 1-dehydrogenase n=1 Tax=Sphingomonas liriopis TaxID=2949094 RepID=A0A9X2HYI1_9SPHN|nr:glucose 1-dehydrogenase [Sphingomonas liriopis]MCP3735873.1 glucose 1-dehydrogenase [Sphingomonas liriopis]